MIKMPAQHCDVCQRSVMDDGIVYRPNPSVDVYLFILKSTVLIVM